MQCTSVFVFKALKDLFFCVVFIAVENIYPVFIKSSRKLSVNENVAFTFHLNGMSEISRSAEMTM